MKRAPIQDCSVVLMMRESSEARLKGLIQAHFQTILGRLLDVTMDVELQRKQAQ
jgi:hypothetical protein